MQLIDHGGSARARRNLSRGLFCRPSGTVDRQPLRFNGLGQYVEERPSGVDSSLLPTWLGGGHVARPIMKTKAHWSDKLVDLGACSEAVVWARTQNTQTSAWKSCRRGDWMLWILGKLVGPPKSGSRKKLVLACCDCAETSLPIFEKRYPNDARPRKAIETARAWATGTGGVALKNLRAAAAYADAAAAFAATADCAAGAAAATAARSSSLAASADIVRKHYPKAPIL